MLTEKVIIKLETLKRYIHTQPILLSISITILSLGLLFAAKSFEPEPAPLLHWPRILVLILISIVCIRLISYLNWDSEVGLFKPISSWQGKWFQASIPLLLIATLSLTGVNWNEVKFSAVTVSAWLLSNFATGFFEEALMRGLCFTILLKAWGTTRNGVFLAAFLQAFIFGAAHITNLYHMPTLDVFAQIVFATLIGIGFAGLVYLSKSIWPAIIVHSLINGAGTINDFFIENNSTAQSLDLAGYVVVIILFFLLSTIPGLLYLRAGTAQFTADNH